MPTMTFFQPVSMRTVWRVGLTFLVAIAWPFACSGLFLQIGFEVVLFQIHLLQNLGVHSGNSLKAIIHFTDPIIWAAIFGLLFGLPLGVLVRTNVMRYWGLMFLTFLLLTAAFEALNVYHASELISEIVLSPYPVYQLGILVVWFFTARAVSRREERLEQKDPSV